MYEQLIKRFYL